jgi:hypothetical protein
MLSDRTRLEQDLISAQLAWGRARDEILGYYDSMVVQYSAEGLPTVVVQREGEEPIAFDSVNVIEALRNAWKSIPTTSSDWWADDWVGETEIIEHLGKHGALEEAIPLLDYLDEFDRAITRARRKGIAIGFFTGFSGWAIAAVSVLT